MIRGYQGNNGRVDHLHDHWDKLVRVNAVIAQDVQSAGIESSLADLGSIKVDLNDLALSSRNQYLSPQERQDATVLYKALQACQEMIEAGATDVAEIRRRMLAVIEQTPAVQIEYVSIVETERLREIDRIEGRVLVALAARLGTTRLIDNIIVDTAGK